jgi:hypothetical protein
MKLAEMSQIRHRPLSSREVVKHIPCRMLAGWVCAPTAAPDSASLARLRGKQVSCAQRVHGMAFPMVRIQDCAVVGRDFLLHHADDVVLGLRHGESSLH